MEGVQVLLTEDNPVNQKLVRLILEKADSVVLSVKEGQSAYEAVGARDFDLVLMDLHMPVLDGLGATRLIRALAGKSNLTILALTAQRLHGGPEYRSGCGNERLLNKADYPCAVDRKVRPLDICTANRLYTMLRGSVH